jgi:nitrite reductase (NO-forming)
MTRHDRVLAVVAWLAFVVMAAVSGPGVADEPGHPGHRHMAQAKPAAPAPKAPASKAPANTPKVSRKSPAAEYTPTVRFRLRTELADGKMAFVGVGGAIEGVTNPPLRVAEGDVVQITLINNDNVEHDVVFPEFDAGTDKVARKGASSVTVFRADKSGEFPYFCSLPGHRPAGMEGKLIVGTGKGPVAALPPSVSIARNPGDLPGPLPAGPPRTHQVELESVELVGRLASETTYTYWTFNGKVPGPFLRVRVGDTVDLTFKNHKDSRMIHSVDFHATTGPGGGAVATQTPPGETKKLRFQALNPGLYVYHCATPMVANHISSGMYGLILVEPPGGLPKVDREYYVMQGELYTDRPYGQQGHDEFSVEKLLAERAEYFVFNGAVGALTTENPMKAMVGVSVRIFFFFFGTKSCLYFLVF